MGQLCLGFSVPINLTWNDITRRHPSFWRHTKFYDSLKIILPHLENIIISDFQAKIYTDNGGGQEPSKDNDLIYLSDENNTYFNKKDDITFKFITQLSSQEAIEKGIAPTICVNAVLDMNENTPINSIYNARTQETAKAEEHYVDAYYTEYSSPKIILETKVHDNNDIKFTDKFYSTALRKEMTVQSINRNLRYNNATLTLKEI